AGSGERGRWRQGAPMEPLVPGGQPGCGGGVRGVPGRAQERGGGMTARRWSDVKAEAMARQPWLASAEAQAQRVMIRAENLGRIRGHELAEMRKSAGLTQAEVAAALGV